jgi:hypothetical protein
VTRFRVNAQQERLDVWLLYRCARCGGTAGRRVLRRLPLAALAPGRLAAYQLGDPALARAAAFELPVREPLPYRVLRPPLAAGGLLSVRIDQPFPSGVRWDRSLARELGWSRSRLRVAWPCSALAIAGVRSRGRRVADGAELRVAMP